MPKEGVEEIEKDMESNRVMNRLVQGDVAPARRLLRLWRWLKR